MPIWEGMLLQTPERGRDRACFRSGCEKFGIRGSHFQSLDTDNGYQRRGYHRYGGLHGTFSDSDWTEVESSDSDDDGDESGIVFPPLFQQDAYRMFSRLENRNGDGEVSLTIQLFDETDDVFDTNSIVSLHTIISLLQATHQT